MLSLPDHELPETPPLNKRQILLLIIRVKLQEIQLLGKRFLWKKPSSCPRCGRRRLWGHGFVMRYFHGYSEGLWMKRWRCPDCRAVHTSRPSEYPAGSQYSHVIRFESLRRKTSGGSFLTSISRQAQQYWRKAFDFQRCLEENWKTQQAFFQESIITRQKPISFRLTHRERSSGLDPPYLDFAVTTRREMNHLQWSEKLEVSSL